MKKLKVLTVVGNISTPPRTSISSSSKRLAKPCQGAPVGAHRARAGSGHALVYRQRAKTGRRFHLFFRYDSHSRIIVYAWINDEKTLRTAGSKHDLYAVFQKRLSRGNPPDDWSTLLDQSSKPTI